MLSYYAERFSTVEINNSFYRMPKAEVLESWTLQVPETFRFVLKAPQTITHRKRLKGVEFERATSLTRVAAQPTLGKRRNNDQTTVKKPLR